MIDISATERIAAAAACGLHEQYLYQILSRRREVAADKCPAIERALAGRVACEALRPDIHWHRVPDAAWPWHPQGRPLIDPAAAVARNA